MGIRQVKKSELNYIVQATLRKKFPKFSDMEVRAEFYGSRSLSHTIRWEDDTFILKISDAFIHAPMYILEIISLILFSKIFRRKIDREVRKIYKQYIYENLDERYLTAKSQRPSANYTAVGKFYNLNDIFDEINGQYFSNMLKKPILGWSLNKSYRRLGFYSSDKGLLVISRIFDSRKTPRNVVLYLMYHEMLHIYIPVTTVNGRRRIHPPEFRKLEYAFPEYEKINKWILKKRYKL
jgi:predicted metal-dependent hydrolase